MDSSASGASSGPPDCPSPKASRKQTRVSGRSLLRFFTVKEPSQQAFEAYQRQLQRKASDHSGRKNVVGLSGISNAKLPSTVPKVNSRWDGVPHAMKGQEKAKKPKRQRSPLAFGLSNRVSKSLSSTSAGSSEPNTRTNSLAEQYGWESASTPATSVTNLEVKKHQRVPKSTSCPDLSEGILSSPKDSRLPPNRPNPENKTLSPITLVEKPKSIRRIPGLNIETLPTKRGSPAFKPVKPSPLKASFGRAADQTQDTSRSLNSMTPAIVGSPSIQNLGPSAGALRTENPRPAFKTGAPQLTRPPGKSRLGLAWQRIRPVKNQSEPPPPFAQLPSSTP